MFTSVAAQVAATRSGSAALSRNLTDVTISATWYAPATDFATFGHKHPSRRPPS